MRASGGKGVKHTNAHTDDLTGSRGRNFSDAIDNPCNDVAVITLFDARAKDVMAVLPVMASHFFGEKIAPKWSSS